MDESMMRPEGLRDREVPETVMPGVPESKVISAIMRPPAGPSWTCWPPMQGSVNVGPTTGISCKDDQIPKLFEANEIGALEIVTPGFSETALG